MTFDLTIRDGTILDGSGRPGVRGDLGIRGGAIVAVGKVEGDAAQVIDADGLAVAPGFIDVHTHYDAQVMWDRMLTISPWPGVTTVVMGNCGFGVAPTRPEGAHDGPLTEEGPGWQRVRPLAWRSRIAPYLTRSETTHGKH